MQVSEILFFGKSRGKDFFCLSCKIWRYRYILLKLSCFRGLFDLPLNNNKFAINYVNKLSALVVLISQLYRKYTPDYQREKTAEKLSILRIELPKTTINNLNSFCFVFETDKSVSCNNGEQYIDNKIPKWDSEIWISLCQLD